MKKKMTMSLALVLSAVLLLTGAALATGINLFDYFGANDDRLHLLAGQSTLQEVKPETVESIELGTTIASIDNAYYNGQSLLLACSIKNSTRMERFIPTEQQLEQAEKQEFCWFDLTEAEEQAVAEFSKDVEAGKAAGLVRYSVSLGDSTKTADGIQLNNFMEDEQMTVDGNAYILREYETPLPEEAQDRDILNVQVELCQDAVYYWFDGTDMYSLPVEYEKVGALTASVQKSDTETALYQGEGRYNGCAVQAEARISPVQGIVTLVSDEQAFPELPDRDSWYMADIQDEQGRTLKVSQFRKADEQNIEFEVLGVGELPDTLTVHVYVESEGEWSREDALKTAGIIQLNLADAA